jgi:hypothetical protein
MTEEEAHYVASSVIEVLDRSRRARLIPVRVEAAQREEVPVLLPQERAPYE